MGVGFDMHNMGNEKGKWNCMNFYMGKKVLITGHTGFKGTWLAKILLHYGAEVIGYARGAKKENSLFEMSGIKERIIHKEGDIRDLVALKRLFEEYEPEIVFHLAAQPIISSSYRNPVYTFETNIMGTVNILECARLFPCVKAVLNITTDKICKKRLMWEYRENVVVDSDEPYSNSKECSELVTHSYKSSFFRDGRVKVSIVRSGNVIGGGDFSNNRIIPACIDYVRKGRIIEVKNPNTLRSYQHVIEVLMIYLMIAKKQYNDENCEDYYDVLPDECISTGKLVSMFCEAWGEDSSWVSVDHNDCSPHKVDCIKMNHSRKESVLQWNQCWNVKKSILKICEFSKKMIAGGDVSAEMDKEIDDFILDSQVKF